MGFTVSPLKSPLLGRGWGDGCRGHGNLAGDLSWPSGGVGLRAADGKARSFQSYGHGFEQIGDQCSYGGVVLYRKHSRLAVEFGSDGYGDISDRSHGFSFGGVRELLFSSIASVRQRKLMICKAKS
jgi:hypothetical protein